MGFRVSWIASRQSKQELLSALGFTDTNEPDEVNEAEFSVAELPTGWTVFWSNDPTYAKIDICQPLALHSPVVSCWVNETAMFSSINYFYLDEYWFVGHDASSDTAIEGEPPVEFKDIIGRAFEAQRKSDAEHPGLVDCLFDIPIEIAYRITGFRHDLVEFEWGAASFTAAKRAENTPEETDGKLGFLKRLFG